MTDAEIMIHLNSNTLLCVARRIFYAEMARIEQAEAQHIPPTPIEQRGMEFDAVIRLANLFDVDPETLEMKGPF